MITVAIGKGIEMRVDETRLPAPVMAHVVYMGLRNILMDSHASHTKEADGDNFVANSQATAERKLNAMYNGEVRSVGQREGDPVRAEAIRICIGHVKAHLRKSGKKLSDIDAKVIREAAIKLLDKNPGILKQAEKRVAELRAAQVDVEGIEV